MMSIEKQVCTRIQAGRLKALGVLQQSLFIWSEASTEPMFAQIVKPAGFWAAAFNVSELGEMLPALIQTFQDDHRGGWNWQELNSDLDPDEMDNEVADRGFRIEAMGDGEFETEAEARADALLYILDNPNAPVNVQRLNDHMLSL